ncbi:MAG TPA: DNA repair and recombination protein RadB [Methanobacteriaceae archaeon]|jgi:DNA repair protein RadB|nr:DNA repair and recombination protein RadB [Euryarchaeota archaeon]HNR25847.1 DNA repair and recombination protein RadB [Methanobacteriaceae archaeon]HNS25177.1 DNA repair and recombination protein RadB [Methanobacteriaceae archaeon]
MLKELSQILSNDKIPTASPLDRLLGGGVEKGCITQFYGPPGSGKTNIVLNLAVECARNNRRTIFVDTEGGLSIERVKQISGRDFEKVASQILVFEPSTFSEQDQVLKRIEEMFQSGEEADLLVVDSAVALYRVKDGDSFSLNQELGKQMGLLLRIARRFNVAVVITNHVYSRFDGDGLVEPVGGTILKYRSKIMVELARGDLNGERFAVLKRHRSRPEGLQTRFRIVDSGLQ